MWRRMSANWRKKVDLAEDKFRLTFTTWIRELARVSGTVDVEATATALTPKPNAIQDVYPILVWMPQQPFHPVRHPQTSPHPHVLTLLLFSDSIPAHCNMPADMGPCRASNPRFHYNATAGQCQLFRFGGCRGNLNNFETIEQCQAECSAGVNQTPSLSSARPEPQGNFH